jgi:hypothetical protein
MFVAIAVSIATAALAFLAPSSASAATLCKKYDGFSIFNAEHFQAGTLCAAPAAEYPNYRNWTRITDGSAISTAPKLCDFSLFPYDIDDIRPMMACPMYVMAPSSPAWKWDGTKWVSARASIGSREYVYPFATGWRWVWNSNEGWRAVESKYVAIRWFTPTGGTASLV